MKPFVKWAGGKRQILEEIKNFIEDSLELEETTINDICYFEPFLGGGAVFLNLMPTKAIVNDLNLDLINAYKIIQSNKIEDLILKLEEYQIKYKEEDRDELYYSTRSKDRTTEWNEMSDIDKAARMIFLNKTCYNGLYRVNSLGQFNTPMGRYKNPLICDKQNLRELHKYFSNNKIIFISSSYENCIRKAGAGDIIYVDPPYDYVDDDGFTKYQMQGFTFEDFKKLKEECDEALKKGAYVIISNNATDRVIDLFNQDPNYKIYIYSTHKLETLRTINCKSDLRRTGKEVIFWGIPTLIPFPQANKIDKIIELALYPDPNIFKDKEAVKKFLSLTAVRQASYYLSALKYFKYINNSFELTDRAINLRKDRNALINDIKKQLIENNDIKYLFEHKLESIDQIASYLNKKYKKINKTTAKRRASTINAWIKKLDLHNLEAK